MKRNIINIVFLLSYTWYLQNGGQYQVNCNSQNIKWRAYIIINVHNQLQIIIIDHKIICYV
jgi:hypothetical protein